MDGIRRSELEVLTSEQVESDQQVAVADRTAAGQVGSGKGWILLHSATVYHFGMCNRLTNKVSSSHIASNGWIDRSIRLPADCMKLSLMYDCTTPPPSTSCLCLRSIPAEQGYPICQTVASSVSTILLIPKHELVNLRHCERSMSFLIAALHRRGG